MNAKMLLVCAIFALSLFGAWTFYEKGKLAERNKTWSVAYDAVSKRADSLARVAAKAETVLVATIDTVKIALSRAILRVDTINLAVHIRDTVWVRQYVDSSQRALATCGVLVRDCEAFRVSANDRFRADSVRLITLESKPERSCKVWALAGLLTGSAAGGYIGFQLGRPK